MKFKHQVAAGLQDVPYVDGDIPAVFAWYPTARKALIWNVTEEKQDYRIRLGEKTLRTVSVDPLDIMLIPDIKGST
jgi:hypothetical protein